jgi:hypothetical protein
MPDVAEQYAQPLLRFLYFPADFPFRNAYPRHLIDNKPQVLADPRHSANL